MDQTRTHWYGLDLTPAQIAAGEKRRLAKRAAEVYLSVGKPTNVAVFSTSLRDEGHVTVYFTPEASVHMQSLIQEFGGKVCDAPEESADELAVIAGDLAAKNRLLSARPA